jgi:hypothetical protein
MDGCDDVAVAMTSRVLIDSGAPARCYTCRRRRHQLATDASGRAALTLLIAPNPALVGLVIDYQWSLLSPGANRLGITTSDGGELTIGQG